MRTPRPRAGRPRWLRLPRCTARLRLTVRYGGAVFLACGATVLAVTYVFYGLLGNAPHPPRPVLHLHKQGKVIPIAAVQPAEATIRMTGLGQLSFDRQQLLIAAGIALAVIAVAAAAIGWLIAGQVLRPLRTITAVTRRISASSLHERLALHGPDDELKELADTVAGERGPLRQRVFRAAAGVAGYVSDGRGDFGQRTGGGCWPPARLTSWVRCRCLTLWQAGEQYRGGRPVAACPAGPTDDST